jgi:hypothetical protein
MDDNAKDVIVAVVGVAGTLLGAIFGFWFADIRRHEPTKRSAYAKFVTLAIQTRQTIESARAGDGDDEKALQANLKAADKLGNDLYQTFASILMLGSRPVAVASMRALYTAMRLVDVPDDQWTEAEKMAADNLDRFIDTARKELGQEPLPGLSQLDAALTDPTEPNSR